MFYQSRRNQLRTSAIIIALCATSLFLPTLPSVAETPLTPAQAVKFKRIAEPRFSPDGRKVIFVVSQVKGTSVESHLWLLDLSGKSSRQFTFSEKSAKSAEWSPDGKSIAYVSKRDGVNQLCILLSDGGEAEAVTSHKYGASHCHWSPDGTQIAYLAEQPETDKEKDSDAEVADNESYLERIWIYNLRTKKSSQLTSGAWKFDDFVWKSNDNLLAQGSNKPREEKWTAALYSVSTKDGAISLYGQPGQPFSSLTISPGRTKISYVGTKNEGPIPHDLFLQDLAGSSARDVSSKLDRTISETRWCNDATPYVKVHDGFNSRIYRLGETQEAKAIELPYFVRAFDVTADGTIVFVAAGFNMLNELFLRRPDGKVEQLSHVQEGWGDISLANAELIHYKSFDGTEIEAALLKPKTAPANGKKCPLVLLVHGGPSSNFTAEYYWFGAWAQLLLARGYQVLKVNPRGSDGYSESFLKANRADWGGGDYKDLMAGVDYVLARGETDPERLGIGGWSYGGEMTIWACTQTKRFKAAVTGGCVFDQVMEFETESGSSDDEWFFGTPWDHPEVFARNSPSTYIRNDKTPTLIVHGKDDRNNPVGQSQALYRALKNYNVETQLVIYPGEPHVPQQEKHQIDVLERMLAWYDRFLAK